MRIGYVSDERYVALADVQLEFVPIADDQEAAFAGSVLDSAVAADVRAREVNRDIPYVVKGHERQVLSR